MKIIVINFAELRSLPPVINLVNCLLENGHTVKLITRDHVGIVNSFKGDFSYCLFDVVTKSNIIRKYIKAIADEYDLIWTTTDISVLKMGKLLFRHKHVMQLMELIEDVRLCCGLQIMHFDIKKYARNAFKVVVPEHHRAYIQKDLWGLVDLPVVLPNKPYRLFDESMSLPIEIKSIIEQMKEEKRKIILYQGSFGPDRDLDVIAEAISQENKNYCLYIMGRETGYSKKLREKYPYLVKIPSLNAPFHLSITKHADIGLLPYVAMKCAYYHVLNAFYCAPNKMFEYAAYGLPMIGTNVAGLDIPFKKFEMGYTYENSVESVLDALSKIEENYDDMSKNAYKFYESVDLDKIVASIIEDGK